MKGCTSRLSWPDAARGARLRGGPPRGRHGVRGDPLIDFPYHHVGCRLATHARRWDPGPQSVLWKPRLPIRRSAALDDQEGGRPPGGRFGGRPARVRSRWAQEVVTPRRLAMAPSARPWACRATRRAGTALRPRFGTGVGFGRAVTNVAPKGPGWRQRLGEAFEVPFELAEPP